jgi:hypothetical protein
MTRRSKVGSFNEPFSRLTTKSGTPMAAFSRTGLAKVLQETVKIDEKLGNGSI